MERPALQQLLSDVRKSPADIVVNGRKPSRQLERMPRHSDGVGEIGGS